MRKGGYSRLGVFGTMNHYDNSGYKIGESKDVYMVALRDEGELIGYYEKHEYRNAETMKPYDLW